MKHDLTVEAVREAVTRLIARGELANPQTLRLEGPHLVIDIDDHLSDEMISGGRIRVVLRSARELHALARALEEVQLVPHHLGEDATHL